MKTSLVCAERVPFGSFCDNPIGALDRTLTSRGNFWLIFLQKEMYQFFDRHNLTSYAYAEISRATQHVIKVGPLFCDSVTGKPVG